MAILPRNDKTESSKKKKGEKQRNGGRWGLNTMEEKNCRGRRRKWEMLKKRERETQNKREDWEGSICWSYYLLRIFFLLQFRFVFCLWIRWHRNREIEREGFCCCLLLPASRAVFHGFRISNFSVLALLALPPCFSFNYFYFYSQIKPLINK